MALKDKPWWNAEMEAVRARRMACDRLDRGERAAKARAALEAHPDQVRPGDWEAVHEQERLAAEGR